MQSFVGLIFLVVNLYEQVDSLLAVSISFWFRELKDLGISGISLARVILMSGEVVLAI